MSDDLLYNAIDGYARDNLYTFLPATIIGVDDFEEFNVIKVLPTIKRRWDDGELTSPSPISRVPVVFQATRQAGLTLPVKVGDPVMLQFCMRNTDDWQQSNGKVQVDTSTPRHHALTDAVAIIGLFPPADKTLQPNKENVELFHKTAAVKLKPDDSIELSNATASMTLMPNGDVMHSSGSLLKQDGDVITSDGKSLRNHTHDVIVTSGSSANTYTSNKPT